MVKVTGSLVTGGNRNVLSLQLLRRRAIVPLIVCGSVSLASCGGTTKTHPSRQQVVAVGAAISDIAYQCQSVAAGFIARPNQRALQRDVDTLISVDRHVLAGARFLSGSGVTATTTLRQQLGLAQQNLAVADCSPHQATRLANAR